MELDPNFALAYVDLGIFYGFEINLAAENLRKAYELRERVSEREKLYISATYYTTVTGELEKQFSNTSFGSRISPRPRGLRRFSGGLCHSGQLEKATPAFQQALALNPDDGVVATNLAQNYIALNHLDEAKVIVDRALGSKSDYPGLHKYPLHPELLQNDVAGMQQQLAWAMGSRRRGRSAHATGRDRGISRPVSRRLESLPARQSNQPSVVTRKKQPLSIGRVPAYKKAWLVTARRRTRMLSRLWPYPQESL